MTSLESGTNLTVDDIPTLRRIPAFTADGQKLGHVGDVYYDEETNQVRCVGLPGDALGVTNVTVPVTGARIENDALILPWNSDQMREAPQADGEITDESWQKTNEYYESAGASSESVTRSEEELRVSKETVPAGTVRLRKWVEVEPVQMDVELQKETARVTREPVNEVAPNAQIGEAEVEVTLHEERPVVEKQMVAKEVVSVETATQTTNETIHDELRKERVEVEGADEQHRS